MQQNEEKEATQGNFSDFKAYLKAKGKEIKPYEESPLQRFKNKLKQDRQHGK